MSGLERSWAVVLRVLPRWHRAEREEELLAVLVADSDDLTREYGWPRPARSGASSRWPSAPG